MKNRNTNHRRPISTVHLMYKTVRARKQNMKQQNEMLTEPTAVQELCSVKVQNHRRMKI